MKRLLLATCIGAVALASFASAQVEDSAHGAWKVYRMGEGGAKQCYVLSAPVKSAGTFKKRGEPYMIVAGGEISLSSGYTYKKAPVLEIDGGKEYMLISEGETAWAKDAAQDKLLVEAMKRGTFLRIKGISKRGTTSIDRYSLDGFSKALARAEQACQ